MIYVSLLVHEQIPVIINQLQNFENFLCDACVVIHVSPSANFSSTDLAEALAKTQLKNWRINPVSVPSAWGSIIAAHLSNIRFIATFANELDRIVFHSSNDMLVQPGLAQYLYGKECLFNMRPVRAPGHWWVGESALSDEQFRTLRFDVGASAIWASQIEGSMYRLDVLRAVDQIVSQSGALSSDVFYPREEIFFSTLAVALGVRSDGLPYVFSAVHRFDRILWATLDKYRWFFSRKSKIVRSVKKRVNARLFDSDGYRINAKDVDLIRARALPDHWLSLDDGAGDSPWRINDADGIFAVKRVERVLNDPLRQYISLLK